MISAVQNMSKDEVKKIIAIRIAKEFKENDIVTLGIGLPTEAANYVNENMNIIFQSENGILGLGKNQIGPNYNKMPEVLLLKSTKAQAFTILKWHLQ